MPEEPTPVEVTNKEPVPVTITGPVEAPSEEKMPSRTTAEQDRTTLGQRETSWLWERTQSTIAIVVTLTSMLVIVIIIIRVPADSAALQLLSNSFFLIVGFYFSRTNHTKVGGVGDTAGKER